MSTQEVIPVSAAVLWRDGRVLLAQRPASDSLGLKWEFPGGKIESGETPEECIERELAEELQIRVKAGRRLHTTLHSYRRHTVRILFLDVCLIEGTPEPTEHARLAWVRPEALLSYELAPADIPMAEILACNGRLRTEATSDFGSMRNDDGALQYRHARDHSPPHGDDER